jgi:hypothetical protein
MARETTERAYHGFRRLFAWLGVDPFVRNQGAIDIRVRDVRRNGHEIRAGRLDLYR